MTLRLIEVLPLDLDVVLARCVDGERAGPRDDSSGNRSTSCDLDRIDQGLIDPLQQLTEDGVNEDFVALLRRLGRTPVADRLNGHVLAMMHNQVAVDTAQFHAAMKPILWFLHRAKGEGIPLTSAGYLRPEDVAAAAEVVPGAEGWIGKRNRETQTVPVLRHREMLQSLGLLRKRQGRLRLTRAGQRGLVDSGFLWGHIASRLIPVKPGFEKEVSQVILVCALAPGGVLDQNLAAESVTALGWTTDGRPLSFSELRGSTYVLDLLMNLTGPDVDKRKRLRTNALARLLAWEALRWPD